MRAIDRYLEPLDDNMVENIEELNRINSIMQLTCVYSPDHEKGGLYDKHLDKLKQYLPVTVDLGKALDEVFFSELYVNRNEEKNIIDIMAGGNYLLFVTGLVGVGKTVVLHKIKHDYESLDKNTLFLLLNFRKEISKFEEIPVEDFQRKVKDWIFEEVLNNLSDDLYRGWLDYRILKEDTFAILRSAYELATNSRLTCLEDIERLRNYDRFEDSILASVDNISPNLKTLLDYINFAKIPMVVCFDNVDRRSYQEQCDITSIGDSIVQEFGIPTIIAIRSTNIRAIVFESRQRRGDRSDLSSVFFGESMSALESGREKTVEIQDLNSATIKNMIEKRINFLHKNSILGCLEELRLAFLTIHDMTAEDFTTNFWNVFDTITQEFVERGMYKYSNFNIRELLVQYVGFVSTLLFNPEEEYRWDKFVFSGHNLDNTLLRTFLLKWQINNGSVDPRRSSKDVINIFTEPSSGLSLLPLRILNYVSNCENEAMKGKLTFKELLDNFSRLQIDEEILKKHLLNLSKSRGAHELGLLWIDSEKIARIEEDSIIELNPAGDYFLEKYSNTREYAFWCSISADLQEGDGTDIDIVKRDFKIADTYKDWFKLDIVYNFIDMYLLPRYEEDIEYIYNFLTLPSGFKGNKMEFFIKKFTRENRFYISHLIANIIGSINDERANLDEKEREFYYAKYINLQAKFRRINTLP